MPYKSGDYDRKGRDGCPVRQCRNFKKATVVRLPDLGDRQQGSILSVNKRFLRKIDEPIRVILALPVVPLHPQTPFT